MYTMPVGTVHNRPMAVRFVLALFVHLAHNVAMNSKRTTKKPAASNLLAVGYVRVSTEDQGLGLEAQRAALAVWAERAGVTLLAVFEDRGVSGGAAIDRRPGLLAALDALAGCGAGVLVVAKRDRLARDVLNAAMIERMAERVGARVVSAAGEGEGSDPGAKLMRTMIDAFAEYERAVIRGRTVVALAALAARGEKVGGVQSYGVADGVSAERGDAEREILAAVLAARASGLSIRAIVAELAERGMLTRRGGAIQPTQVARILKRAA